MLESGEVVRTMDILEQASHADLMRVLDYVYNIVHSPEANDSDKVEALQLVLNDTADF